MTLNERVIIFIDARNILIPAAKVKIKIDWLKLRDLLKDKRNLIRTYYFDGEPSQLTKGQDKFYTFLRSNGFKVMTKPLKTKIISCDNCKLGSKLKRCGVALPSISIKSPANSINLPYQKGVDVALATELLRMGRENVFDTAIIVSGDNDFTSAADCISTWGKTIEIASFRKPLGEDLKRMAQRLWILDDHLKWIKFSEKDF